MSTGNINDELDMSRQILQNLVRLLDDLEITREQLVATQTTHRFLEKQISQYGKEAADIVISAGQAHDDLASMRKLLLDFHDESSDLLKRIATLENDVASIIHRSEKCVDIENLRMEQTAWQTRIEERITRLEAKIVLDGTISPVNDKELSSVESDDTILDIGLIEQASETVSGMPISTVVTDIPEHIIDENRIVNYDVGSIITMGRYPQTASGTDLTPIEWVVLERRDNSVLLISRYALDVRAYNDTKEDVTWETCTLRKWLNGEFLNHAFTDAEKGMIIEAAVSNGGVVAGLAMRMSFPENSEVTTGGNNTHDHLFLLDYREANAYLHIHKKAGFSFEARVAPTAYSISKGAYTTSSFKTADKPFTGKWWLRSPGKNQHSAAQVNKYGVLDSCGVDKNDVSVRPVFWLNIESQDTEIYKTATPRPILSIEEAANCEVGSIITFGRYPQTKSGTDRTLIEWQVLERRGNRALIISRFGLDAKPYNEKYAEVTWERCDLRRWLNRKFYNSAFTVAEKRRILKTEVDNSSSQCFNCANIGPYDEPIGSNNTQDFIFLLSYAEANKYLSVNKIYDTNLKSRTSPTDYAINHGADVGDDDCKTADGVPACSWWLRSPGHCLGAAAIVYCDGAFDYTYDVHETFLSVRPALWINLESEDAAI